MGVCSVVIFFGRSSPLVGFFGKFFVFYNLVVWSNFSVFLLVLLLTVISSVYYIRLIQVMFFKNIRIGATIISVPYIIGVIIVLAMYLNIVECIWCNCSNSYKFLINFVYINVELLYL